MKKIIFFLFLLMLPSIASAQVWVTAGYGFSWLNSDGMNYVIDRYNSTRNFLTKDMEQPGVFSGFAFNAGLNFVNVQMDVRYSSRSTQITSEGNVSGTNFKREIDIDYDFYGFGIGFGDFNEAFGYSLGVDLEIVSPGMVTRIDPGTETEVDISQFATAVSPQFVFFIKFGNEIPLGISVRTYYTFGLTEIDYDKLNETINPNTYPNDPADKQSSKFSGFGIELQFGFLTSLGF